MAGEVVIRARELTKRYGANIAVDHIDLEVGAGEIVGILGPNGSGKTTTILMLLGLTEPTSGHAEVAGFDPLRDPLEVKRRVGYLPDQVGFYDGLSARDNLAYTGRLAGLPRAEIDDRFAAAMDRVGLGDVGRDRVRTFSQGMRQRLGLAEVLMKRPSVAILDEPTTALDPHSTQEFLEMIRALKADGTAVLLSSHHLDQVQSVCDRVEPFNRCHIDLWRTGMAPLGLGSARSSRRRPPTTLAGRGWSWSRRWCFSSLSFWPGFPPPPFAKRSGKARSCFCVYCR